MEQLTSSLLEIYFQKVNERLIKMQTEMQQYLSALANTNKFISNKLLEFAKSFSEKFSKELLNENLELIEKEVKVILVLVFINQRASF
jgi:hypothetical protein